MKLISRKTENLCTVLLFDPEIKYEHPLSMRLSVNGKQYPVKEYSTEKGNIKVVLSSLERGSSLCVICFYEGDRLVYRCITRCINYSVPVVKNDIAVSMQGIIHKAEQLFKKEVDQNVTG